MKKWLPMFVALVFLLIACADSKSEKKEEATLEQNATTISGLTFSCDALFFGDSITCDGNFDELFPELRVVNLGVYGDTIDDLIRRVPEVKAENPEKIFLLGGINSLHDDNSELCLERYAVLLDTLRQACPRAELIVQSVLPLGTEVQRLFGCSNETIRAFNSAIRRLAEDQGCIWADLWPAYAKDGALNPDLTRDGLHLNFNAYGPWRDSIIHLINASSKK